MQENNINSTEENSITNVRGILDASLKECQPVVDFAGNLGSASTEINVCDGAVYVNMYYVDDSAVVTIDYMAGMCVADTAFCGDVEDVHRAVVRVARHTDCEVIRDEFDVLPTGGDDDE